MTKSVATYNPSILPPGSPSVSVAPLATFRVLFGLLHLYGALRFLLSGWAEKLYGEPTFFFKFYGFGWVPTPSVTGAYVLYGLIALSALAVALGWRYRWSVAVFFLSFGWAELIDATNYLNHYYLVLLLTFLLFFIPAHAVFSLDARAGRTPRFASYLPLAWCRPLLMVQIGIVYFFAGLAKLNADWLFEAMPLAVWLPAKADFPVLGSLFAHSRTAYAFSWFGAFYDLTIVAWLLWRPTRPFAYLAVLAFHLLTWVLFNIGLFPLIMITSTLIFFSPAWHEKLWRKGIYRRRHPEVQRTLRGRLPAIPYKLPPTPYLLPATLYLLLQLLLPLRDHLYPGPTAWTEEGYRFGWRVMLVEKNGQATFRVRDPRTGRQSEVDNAAFLTPFQEKQMAIQPDFILQYAGYLADIYAARYGIEYPVVTADVFVALNGRPSSRFVDPEVNLAALEDGFGAKEWILPFEDSR